MKKLYRGHIFPAFAASASWRSTSSLLSIFLKISFKLLHNNSVLNKRRKQSSHFKTPWLVIQIEVNVSINVQPKIGPYCVFFCFCSLLFCKRNATFLFTPPKKKKKPLKTFSSLSVYCQTNFLLILKDYRCYQFYPDHKLNNSRCEHLNMEVFPHIFFSFTALINFYT